MKLYHKPIFTSLTTPVLVVENLTADLNALTNQKKFPIGPLYFFDNGTAASVLLSAVTFDPNAVNDNVSWSELKILHRADGSDLIYELEGEVIANGLNISETGYDPFGQIHWAILYKV